MGGVNWVLVGGLIVVLVVIYFVRQSSKRKG